MGDPQESLAPLFEAIIEHVPAPKADKHADEPVRILAVLMEADPYLGRLLTGRVESGRITPNMAIHALSPDGKEVERGRISKVLAFRGLKRQPVEFAEAGDIVAIAGLAKATVADTVCAPEVTVALPAQPIDPPTIAFTVAINDSPLAGREGDKVQSRVIRERLLREAETNVAIRVTETDDKDAYEVAGRGELQLGVLIESMRREGFEVSISRPRVVFRTDEHGKRLEPIEEVVIDLDDEYSGVVIEKLSARKAEMKDLSPAGVGKARLTFLAPSRALIGYHGEFLTDTRGSGVMNRVFHAYEPYKGAIEGRRNGVLVSNSDGETAAFALWNLEDRGVMFVGGQREVLPGHDHRRERQARRPGRQSDEVQAAHQCAGVRQGRVHPPDPAAPADAGTGHRLCRGRRAGRGDAQVDPPAQARAEPLVPQEAHPGRRLNSDSAPGVLGGPPSSFDRLGMRATDWAFHSENLILSLSKDEDFGRAGAQLVRCVRRGARRAIAGPVRVQRGR